MIALSAAQLMPRYDKYYIYDFYKSSTCDNSNRIDKLKSKQVVNVI